MGNTIVLSNVTCNRIFLRYLLLILPWFRNRVDVFVDVNELCERWNGRLWLKNTLSLFVMSIWLQLKLLLYWYWIWLVAAVIQTVCARLWWNYIPIGRTQHHISIWILYIVSSRSDICSYLGCIRDIILISGLIISVIKFCLFLCNVRIAVLNDLWCSRLRFYIKIVLRRLTWIHIALLLRHELRVCALLIGIKICLTYYFSEICLLRLLFGRWIVLQV